MQTIRFDSNDLPGHEALRREQWVDLLSSGYVRLRADARSDLPFDGQLRIMQLGHTAVGRISGTVETIARTRTEIAAENTDNVVLLMNRSRECMLVEQKGVRVTCTTNSAVLIEQCEASAIEIGRRDICDFVALQLPRQELRKRRHGGTACFMTLIPGSASLLALTNTYVDALLAHHDPDAADTSWFAADHVADLIAATVASQGYCPGEAPSLRAARLQAMLAEIDRHFMKPGFSLKTLARRFAVSPRQVQVLLAEAGTSFTDEMLRRRLAQAHEMLRSQRYAHLSVIEIAHSCGFSTVSHFHRIFRRNFAATPGDVRDLADS
ncbi:AraC family transcriptional regulator [Bradyrhizobium commune]|uniref:AraC family transcriptional regulator n=1 Tax=Bradyrhizobium commune TaxID=83627 RepID=A0A7S9H0X8_9BRAD|nr:AraC family transcriptional regulator [Bradyrhizobium commune]QPF92416.1 AraC family transcriptional regulator [Bradyrhizobium commune]